MTVRWDVSECNVQKSKEFQGLEWNHATSSRHPHMNIKPSTSRPPPQIDVELGCRVVQMPPFLIQFQDCFSADGAGVGKVRAAREVQALAA